mgnify:CR=1 FL=1
MSDIVDACIAQARASGKRLVFPEGHDERIVAAARRLKDDGIAIPILLGASGEIGAAAARAGVTLEGILTLDPEESGRLGAYAGLYSAGRPNASAKVAERLVRKPLFHAGMMVKAGDADAIAARLARALGVTVQRPTTNAWFVACPDGAPCPSNARGLTISVFPSPWANGKAQVQFELPGPQHFRAALRPPVYP